jgi:hypothetical protein
MKPKAYTPRKLTEVVAIQVNVEKQGINEIEEVFYFVYGTKWKSIKNKSLFMKDYLRGLFCDKVYTFENIQKAHYLPIIVHDLDYIVKPELTSDTNLVRVYDERTFNSIFLELDQKQGLKKY